MKVKLIRSNTLPVAGDVRFNKTTQALEIYNATTWQTMMPPIPDPQTWREWLDYYADQTIYHGGVDHKLLYIRNKMWERFPGPYTIKHVGDCRYDLEFDTPADATWWHLKYD